MLAELLPRHHTSVITFDELWYRVEAAWPSVPVHAIQCLFDSMPRRISAVITDRGNCFCLFINSWEGISELGPRRHKETHQQCVLFAPDPVTTARLETHNVYPDIGAHGARTGMRRNRCDRLRDNSSKEPSPIEAEKGQNIRG
ncbi:hypothetical protein TNCV_3506581 [Trichonephila clavipes]|uniref:Uncharacterized protein n=1 Tax=Trichonephila clavipes TaxID=2585209 RepID=A0A8X6S964_TRICX|nr:hypothetical protein TNCV_3506581 [Trichonephila clavipes]